MTYMCIFVFFFRIELYVILCSDDVYKQEVAGTTVTPNIPYHEVNKN
jgi:hypothetical protein